MGNEGTACIEGVVPIKARHIWVVQGSALRHSVALAQSNPDRTSVH